MQYIFDLKKRPIYADCGTFNFFFILGVFNPGVAALVLLIFFSFDKGVFSLSFSRFNFFFCFEDLGVSVLLFLGFGVLIFGVLIFGVFIFDVGAEVSSSNFFFFNDFGSSTADFLFAFLTAFGGVFKTISSSLSSTSIIV